MRVTILSQWHLLIASTVDKKQYTHFDVSEGFDIDYVHDNNVHTHHC